MSPIRVWVGSEVGVTTSLPALIVIAIAVAGRYTAEEGDDNHCADSRIRTTASSAITAAALPAGLIVAP